MSEYLLRLYRPIADAILREHGLVVDEEMRDALAKTILFNRTLPVETEKPSRSAMPALKVAKTHAKALLKYTRTPPTDPVSMEIRSRRLEAALRSSELVRVTLFLAEPSFDSLGLLRDLEVGKARRETLRQLLLTLESLLRPTDPDKSGGIGRPWANFTPIVRSGCLAWHRAGREIDSSWDMAAETISGELPKFLRDLIACCDGTHARVAGIEQDRRMGMARRELARQMEMARRELASQDDSSVDPPPTSDDPPADPLPKGNKLKASDMALRDAIRAYREWFKANERKNPTLFFRQH